MNITRYTLKNNCLRPWIKFIWHMEAENASIHNKLLPTDCIDVILNLADDMIYETEAMKYTAPAFHINGLRSKYSYIHQEHSIHVYGISFYPFGLYPFVHKSPKVFNNKIVDLADLSISLTNKLTQAFKNDSTDCILNAIENALISELLLDSDFIDKARLISEFMSIDDSVSIQTFCLNHSISIKTLERMFLYYTGFTPKALRNIRRFQNTSNQLVHQPNTSLTDITYNHYFSDQSHLIRDFERFSGTAPRTFQSEKITVKENANYTYL